MTMTLKEAIKHVETEFGQDWYLDPNDKEDTKAVELLLEAAKSTLPTIKLAWAVTVHHTDGSVQHTTTTDDQDQMWSPYNNARAAFEFAEYMLEQDDITKVEVSKVEVDADVELLDD